jgi:hypothetical protein
MKNEITFMIGLFTGSTLGFFIAGIFAAGKIQSAYGRGLSSDGVFTDKKEQQ